MNKIPLNISNKVLIVGPDYKNHRGGIGAIIGSYSTIFENFKFVATFRPYHSNVSKSLFFLKQIFVLTKKLAFDRDIAIVHMHGSHKGSFFRKLAVFWIAKRLFNKKVIYHLNSSSFDIFFNQGSSFVKKRAKYLMENVDLVVCVSPWWKNFYSSAFKLKDITIINNIVNAPPQGLKAKKEHQIVNFLFLGRVGDRKGIFDLLDVLTKERESLTGKMKLFIGGDGEIEKLKSIIESNNLQQLVEYIGWVDADLKQQYLLNSSVYILPSYNEGLPISILEAMSFGLPIVSTIVGGTPEVLKNNENGFIFEAGDKPAMENAIRYLLNNKEKITEFGKDSLKKVQPYLAGEVARQLLALYNNLLK